MTGKCRDRCGTKCDLKAEMAGLQAESRALERHIDALNSRLAGWQWAVGMLSAVMVLILLGIHQDMM